MNVLWHTKVEKDLTAIQITVLGHIYYFCFLVFILLYFIIRGLNPDISPFCVSQIIKIY